MGMSSPVEDDDGTARQHDVWVCRVLWVWVFNLDTTGAVARATSSARQHAASAACGGDHKGCWRVTDGGLLVDLSG